MKPSVDDARKILGAGVLLIAVVGLADVRENPYDVIVERNAFNIHPAPPPAPVDTTPPPPVVPPATVKLTGITTLGGKTNALLEITPGPGKQPVKPIMAIGDRIETVELLAIDVENSKVTVRNGTIETNLEFEITQSAAAPKAAPGVPVPIRPGVAVPNPAIHPATTGAPAGAYNTSSRSYGNRGSVTVAGAEVATSTSIPSPAIAPRAVVPPGAPAINRAGTYNATAPAVPTYRTIPPRQIRTTPTPTTATAPPMTKEEAMINLEAMRMISPPNAPPLPPTPLTPSIQE